VLGTLPVGFQPLESPAHALIGDLLGDDPLLEADLGGQFQGPGAAILAKIEEGWLYVCYQAAAQGPQSALHLFAGHARNFRTDNRSSQYSYDRRQTSSIKELIF
jgi:hypothetical protein